MDIETATPAAVPAPQAYAVPHTQSRLESRLLRRIARFLPTVPIAFEIAVAGRVHRLGEGPAAFRGTAHDRSGLPALASLDQGGSAEAYMASAIALEGDMLRFLELRNHVPDSPPLHFVWRFLHPLLVGQVSMNATAIRSHYDRDAEFFLAFLGEPRCYTQGVFERDDEQL